MSLTLPDHVVVALRAALGERPSARTMPTTCIETVGGDPATALRLSFQIKVF